MKILVLGAGAWGTALAVAASAAGRPVCLWARDAAQAALLEGARCNTRYLPEVPLPPALAVRHRLDEALAWADGGLLVVATPMAGLRGLLAVLPAGQPVLWLSKGFEQGSGLLGHEIARELRPGAACGVLSGPSFALEVARGLPTALVAASADEALSAAAVAAFHGGPLRIYTSTDMVGVEVGGGMGGAPKAGFRLGQGPLGIA